MENPSPTATQAALDEPHARSGQSGLAGLGILCFGAWLCASADPATLRAGALTLAGLLMVWRPVTVKVSVLCWGAAGIWLCASLAAFLPSHWMTPPAWRDALVAAGIDTGKRITPQPLAALGSLATATATGMVALWAAHQRTSDRRGLGMAFAAAVVAYALASWMGPSLLNHRSNALGTFGFFPNRNHTATLLAMGAIVTLGLLAQGIRRKRAWQIAGGSVFLAFLLWAIFSLIISRAGIALACAGGLLWLTLTGTKRLRGNAGKAVALVMGGGMLIFLLADTPVKQRIDQVLGRVSTSTSHASSGSNEARLESLDGRVEIFRDTAAMIADAPWTGWGAGQFAVIFPQYQNRSSNLTASQCLHPESDWLWRAAESGVPATLALAALAVLILLPVVQQVRHGNSRAMRAGFLAAALLLPLHGFFDVPGHKFSLIWASALLLALAAGHGQGPRWPRVATAGWRVAGLAVTSFGLWLLVGEWNHQPRLASDHSERLIRDAMQLYTDEHQNPSENSDRVSAAIAKLAAASALTPMDNRIYGLQGMWALHDDELDELARTSFARQRALEPTWVSLPLAQAAAWSKISPHETTQLWVEAMRRASVLEARFPQTPWRSLSYDKILKGARHAPDLTEAATAAAGNDPALLEKAARLPRPKDAKPAP